MRNKNHKLSGSTLIAALVVSLIISLLISSIILLQSYQRNVIVSHYLLERIKEDALSGFNLLLSGETNKLGVWTEETASKREDVLVNLTNVPWGLFQLQVSTIVYKNDTLGYAGLVSKAMSNKQAVLFLEDTGQPLALCGQTKIVGDCCLPPSGVRMAFIEGKQFAGKELITGKILACQQKLIEPTGELMDYLERMFQHDSFEWCELYQWENGLNEIEISFLKSTRMYFSEDEILLNNGKVSGNVIIKSDKEVIISADISLNEVIIVAPRISIMSGFTGSIQLVATEQISISENVELVYPSSVTLISSSNSLITGEEHTIDIGSNTTITGSLVYHNSQFQQRGGINIGLNSKINGLVYSNNYVELKGRMNGILQTKFFRLKTPSAVYTNHLLDAEITYNLPSSFLYGNLLDSFTANKVVKWLN